MVIDQAFLDKAESLAAQGLTKEQIALSLGIHIATLHRKKKENRELSEAIKRGEAKGLTVVTNALFKSAKEGNVTAQIFYLKNRDSDRWKDRHHVEETRRHVGIDSEVKNDMTPQEAAESYADTLKSGKRSNVVPLSRRR